MRRRSPILYETVMLSEKRYRKEKAQIWRAIGEILEKPRRRRVAVNLGRIGRYVNKEEIAVVPGKVLGAGKLDKPITVAALSFTGQAERKIREAGGRCLTLKELMEGEYKPSNLVIIG
ncbi:MAG: 50S ribosomal protein L18e [Candidatus Bathyarchaeia archaeon]